MKPSRPISTALLAACLAGFVTAGADASWYDPAWSQRKKLTVDAAQVAATLSDFPLLVSITDADVRSEARADGFDILFTADDGTTKLDHEIERWDDGTGELVAWVRVPTLAGGADTELYLYYGNAAAADQQNAAGVWAGYAGVWHLGETSGTRYDSTANGNNLADVNTVGAAGGVAAGGADFERGASEKLEIADAAQAGLDPAGDLTFQAWFKPESTGDAASLIDKNLGGADGYRLHVTANRRYGTEVWSGGAGGGDTTGPTATAGAWNLVTGVYDGSSVITYVDGAEESTDAYAGGAGDSGQAFTLGATGGADFLDGVLDEVRVCAVARSPAWILTEFNNQSAPASFLSVGPQEEPAADPTLASATNQTFNTGDPPTAVATFTITDGTPASINAGDDLRVRIPAGFSMLWDTADTTAMIAGTAANKVSPTVSYEDLGTTLVLNVISNFAAGEDVTVSGLAFTGFTAVSAADNLELETADDDVVTATDAQTIQIIEPPSACGSPFCYLDAPVDVSPAAVGAWTDVDVSAWVPAGATGVVLRAVGADGGDADYGVRVNGSADLWMPGSGNLPAGNQTVLMIGVDGNRVFEVYTSDAAVKTYLLGYAANGVKFLTDAVTKSPATVGSWQDIDLGDDTGADTAMGAIFVAHNTGGAARSYGLRPKGSSDDRYADLGGKQTVGALVGLDGDEIFQARVQTNAVKLRLVGYVTVGAVFFEDGADRSTATTGSYVTVDISPDIGADDANGAIVEWVPGGGGHARALRRLGAAHDHDRPGSHAFAVVAVDGGERFEQKIADTSLDLHLVGYTLAGTPLGLSSDDNQAFGVGDDSTPIAPVTINDTLPPVINSVDDLRVRIPPAFNMTWDTTDTTAVVAGPAASKVATTVTYEDAGRTLVLDVTTGFAAGETLIVSGLSFTSFAAESAPDNLELDVDNDGGADAADDKTIQIGPLGDTYYVRITGSDGDDGLSPVTAWRTVGKAAATLTAGDWAYVGAGVYDEAVAPANDGTSQNPIRFIADVTGARTGDPGTVEIAGGGAGDVLSVSGADHVELLGFRITGGADGASWDGAAGGLLRDCVITAVGADGVRADGGSSLTVRDCEIHAVGVGADGVVVDGASTVVVEGTRVHDVDGPAVRAVDGTLTLSGSELDAGGADGLRVEGGSATVVNCLIHGNAGGGVTESGGPASVTVWHTTIEGNAADGVRAVAGTFTVRNAIVATNGGTGLRRDGGTLDHAWNLLWDNGANYSGTSAGAGELTADPLFVGDGDLHLTSASPAVDAGTDGSGVTSVDVDGDARPADAGWDMGADEHSFTQPRLLSWQEIEPQ